MPRFPFAHFAALLPEGPKRDRFVAMSPHGQFATAERLYQFVLRPSRFRDAEL